MLLRPYSILRTAHYRAPPQNNNILCADNRTVREWTPTASQTELGMAAHEPSPPPTTDEKLSLLKKAYRSLKQESERREEAMAAERAASQRERGALLARIDELTRELEALRDSVRKAGAEARERLLEDELSKSGSSGVSMRAASPEEEAMLITTADGGAAGAGFGYVYMGLIEVEGVTHAHGSRRADLVGHRGMRVGFRYV